VLTPVVLLALIDTVALRTLPRAPQFDGTIGAAEYGVPVVTMATLGGPVTVWLGRSGGWVYVAATLPDSTASWRDEFALLLDPVGDRTPAPGHDDGEWVIRRVVDSSEVLRGVHGRWQLPGDDPAWRLGAARGGEGWEVRANSTSTGWQVELRIEADWLAGTYGGTPAMAFRAYDDSVRVWTGWPVSAVCPDGARLERLPPCWSAVLGEAAPGR
jgi:hypothetical protein